MQWHPAGVLEYGLGLRRDIARVIRRRQPDAVVVGSWEVEFGGKRGCGYWVRRCAQLLNDVEQAVGPAHFPALDADTTLSVCRR